MEKKLTKEQIEKIKREQVKKYGSEFISYVNSYESAAIFIVRDVVKSINTGGKWIDILGGTDAEKNKAGRWDFKKIAVEIFPRKIQPDYKIYPENASEEMKLRIDIDNKYLTWKTAHEDVANQRRAGFSGEKFEVQTKLINKNRGKFKEEPRKEIWNTYINQWIPLEYRTPHCDENKIREVGIKKIPLEPDWEYYILAIKRL